MIDTLKRILSRHRPVIPAGHFMGWIDLEPTQDTSIDAVTSVEIPTRNRDEAI